MNKVNIKYILILTVLVLVAGGLYVFWPGAQPPAQNGEQEQNTEVQQEWTRAEVPELGFSFEYPAQWGQAQFTEHEGGYSGTRAFVTFSESKLLTVGGISEDYSEGRGGTSTDTQGFAKEGDDYFFKFVSTSTIPIEPVKSIDTDLGEVIVVNHESFGSPSGPAITVNLGALVNLDDETYSGVLFLNRNPAEFPQDMFESMLKTLKPFSVEEEMTVRLYFYNPALDQGPGGAQCTREGLVAVERTIPPTITPLRASIELLLQEEPTAEEEAQGLTSEFPLPGVALEGASIEEGVATFEFSDPQNQTSGGACRTGILWGQIEETAKQFPSVESARFMPEELFQP